jgi:hypothetical protein
MFHHIDMLYNLKRRHTIKSRLSPAEFERQYFKNQRSLQIRGLVVTRQRPDYKALPNPYHSTLIVLRLLFFDFGKVNSSTPFLNFALAPSDLTSSGRLTLRIKEL